jgi:hypothetical protein
MVLCTFITKYYYFVTQLYLLFLHVSGGLFNSKRMRTC